MSVCSNIRNRLYQDGLYACILNNLYYVDIKPPCCPAKMDYWIKDWSQLEATSLVWNAVYRRVQIQCDIRRVSAKKEGRSRNIPTFFHERSHYGRGKFMIWAEINICGHSNLHVIGNSTLVTQKYTDEILRLHVELTLYSLVIIFIFMYDNARPYTAQLAENMREAKTVQRMK